MSDLEVYRWYQWSPDGRSFLLQSLVSGGQSAVALLSVPAAGGETKMLTEGLSTAFLGRWSPDGTRIAFHANANPPGEEQNFEVFVMDADGSDRRRLTDDPASDRRPHWSPDGSEILFDTNRNGNRDIAAVPVEGGPVRMVIDSPLVESINDISRDGANLVYFAIPPDNQIVRVGVEPLLEGPGK